MDNPEEMPEVKLIKAFGQMDKMIEPGAGTADIRDYLYLCFLLHSRLLRAEILGLRWQDIDYRMLEIRAHNRVTFPEGQNEPVINGTGERIACAVHLESELKKRIEPFRKKKGYIFSYNRGNTDFPMTREMVEKMWERITVKLGLSGFTEQSFLTSYYKMINGPCIWIDVSYLMPMPFKRTKAAGRPKLKVIKPDQEQ